MLKGRQSYTVAQFLYSAGFLGVQGAVDIINGKQPANRNAIAPMLGLTKAKIKGILAGKVKVPASLGLVEKLKRAQKGCK